jgi:hypothetical protein
LYRSQHQSRKLWKNLSDKIRIWFRRKLRGNWILVMLATTPSRIFCLLVCCLKT